MRTLPGVLATLTACGLLAGALGYAQRNAPFELGVPAHFPAPRIPADNPLSASKVELGRHLFYDRRLSRTGHTACATCHVQARAFTDGKARAVGDTGEVHPRGALSIVNAVYVSRLGWQNPLLDRLEDQARVPMFGEDPVEMGLTGREGAVVALLRSDPPYPRLFHDAFPGDADPFTTANVTRAIASFERTIISGRSPYDRFVGGDASALGAAAKRGMDLFLSERLECFHCHGGFNFSDSVTHAGSVAAERAYHNTGLYNLGPSGAYPPGGGGLYEATHDPADMGRFRAPTLRNVAVTAPYMHDGSVPTLEAVLDHYAEGGRTVAEGPYAGVGSKNPHKSEFVAGFVLTPGERSDVVAFLESLTDEELLTDPRFGDPRAPGPATP
jgi:cytochrome c peroxidase